MFKDYELLLHPTFAVLAMLAIGWVYVETLHPQSGSEVRISRAAKGGAIMMWLSYVTAGIFYVLYYGADKAVIKAGPWPWAHGLFMETKEHVFFLVLLLATFLPIAVAGDVFKEPARRKLVLWTSCFAILLVLALEGAGAIISMGVKVGLTAPLAS